MNTGEQIKQARIGVGMTAKALAAAIGVTPEHLSRVENGRSPVTKMLALAVRVALKKGF